MESVRHFKGWASDFPPILGHPRGFAPGPGPENEGLYYSPKKYFPRILNIYVFAHKGLIRGKMAQWSRVIVSHGPATRSLGLVHAVRPCPLEFHISFKIPVGINKEILFPTHFLILTV